MGILINKNLIEIIYMKNYLNRNKMGIGDWGWGLGIGDWGLEIGRAHV